MTTRGLGGLGIALAVLVGSGTAVGRDADPREPGRLVVWDRATETTRTVRAGRGGDVAVDGGAGELVGGDGAVRGPRGRRWRRGSGPGGDGAEGASGSESIGAGAEAASDAEASAVDDPSATAADPSADPSIAAGADPSAVHTAAAAPAAPPGELVPVAAGPSKVFGRDNRYFVGATSAFPWSTVCKVYARFPSGAEFTGSGVVIDRKHVLTAGHVVFDAAEGGWADVTVVPGYDTGSRPFGTYVGATLTSFQGWTQSEDFAWDMALIETDRAIGDATGWLGRWSAPAGVVRRKRLTTAGYPGDVGDGEFMVTSSGRVRRVASEHLLYAGTLDTYSGQSGSGLWLTKGRSRYVVGVVAWSNDVTNGGTRLSAAKYEAIEAWIAE